MKLLYGHEAAVGELVASLIPGMERGFEPNFRAIGVIDNEGRLIGGFVYHNYCPEHGVIEMSGASLSKRWLNRKNLTALFGYPFKGAKCQAAFANVGANNKALHRQFKAVGFAEYVIPRLRGEKEAAHLFVLTNDAWAKSRFNGDLKNG